MPKGVGYEHWHQGATDTPADYAIKDNPGWAERGTNPDPFHSAHGKSSVKNPAEIATSTRSSNRPLHGK